jgi:small subunit ribosomal protein S9
MVVEKKKKIKKTTVEKVEKKEIKKETKKKYIEAVGRRKESIARVRLVKDSPGFIINEKTMEEYFSLKDSHRKILEPFKITHLENTFFVSVKVNGGGITGQTEAIRLGISRCLVKIDEHLRSALKKAGFLKRDARIVERKKCGLKKARKAAQWSKR